jgi:uncharacterized protein YjaZ
MNEKEKLKQIKNMKPIFSILAYHDNKMHMEIKIEEHTELNIAEKMLFEKIKEDINAIEAVTEILKDKKMFEKFMKLKEEIDKKFETLKNKKKE